MTTYWEQWPPLHKMVATYLGLGKAPPKETDEQGLSVFDVFPKAPVK